MGWERKEGIKEGTEVFGLNPGGVGKFAGLARHGALYSKDSGTENGGA